MNEKEFINYIREKYNFRLRGGQKKFADQFGIRKGHVSGMFSGKVPIPKRVVEALGFQRVVLYEKRKEAKP